MNLININCDPSTIRNFGIGNCTTEFGAWKYAILVPKAWTLTPAEYAALLPSLLADNTDDNYDERIYLIGNFHTSELAYQDANVQTFPDGSTRETRAAVAGWRLSFYKGGICSSRALQSIDGLQDTYNIVFVSTKNHLIGTQRYNETTGLIEFAGFDLSMLTAETPQVGTFDAVDNYSLMVQLADMSQMFTNPMFIGAQVDQIVANMPNITDVQLQSLEAIDVSGVIDIAAAAGCGAVNLATSATAASWANVARWVATNYQTGAAVTITSVAAMANGAGFTFDFDSADGDYPTSGQYLALQTAPVSTLVAAGLKYYESYAQNFGSLNGVKLLIKIP